MTAAGNGPVKGLDSLYYAVGYFFLSQTETEMLTWEMRVRPAQGDTVVLENFMPVRGFQTERVSQLYALYKDNTLQILNRQYVLTGVDAENNAYDFFFANLFNIDDEYVEVQVSSDGSAIATPNDDYYCYWYQPQASAENHVFDEDAAAQWDRLASATFTNYQRNTRTIYAKGVDLTSGNTDYWEMLTENGQNDTVYFRNVIAMGSNNIDVYGIRKGNQVTIPYTQTVGYISSTYAVNLVNLTESTDEKKVVSNIVMTEAEDGSYSVPEGSTFAYYAAPVVDGQVDFYAEDADVYSGYDNVTYAAEDWAVKAPTANAEVDGVSLYAALSDDYYIFGNYAMVAPYQDVNYATTTPAPYDSIAWQAYVLDNDWNVSDSILGNKSTFTIYADPANLYTSPYMAVWNEAGISSKNVNANDIWAYYGSTYLYLFSGGSSDTYASMNGRDYHYSTAQYDRSVSAADFHADYNASSVFSYQGKPKSTLYFDSVSVAAVDFTSSSATETLTLFIRRCSRDAEGNIVPGDTIAAADATIADWYSSYTSTSGHAYGVIKFTDFYAFDQYGFDYPYERDFFNINDEFMFELQGLDKECFSLYLLTEDDYDENGSKFTAYSTADAPNELHYDEYSNARVFFYLDGFAYGYLHTEQPTSLHVDNAGGIYEWTINPMFCTSDDNGNPTTILWVGDDSDTPDWIQYTIPTESYTSEGYEFTLQMAVDALPAGISGRSAMLQFEQWGATLNIEILQGDATSGIQGVQTEARAYKAQVSGDNIVVTCPADVKEVTLYDAMGARVATVPVVGGKATIAGARQGLNIVNFGGKNSVKVVK
jgi:hypothetical protein